MNDLTPHLFKGHGYLAFQMGMWLREYDDYASQETKQEHGEQIDAGVFDGLVKVLTSLSHTHTLESMTHEQQWKAISTAVYEAAIEEMNTYDLIHLRDYCYDVAHRLSQLGDDNDDNIDEALRLINDYFAELYSNETERWGGRA